MCPLIREPWSIVQKYKHMLSVQIKYVRNASKGTLVNCAKIKAHAISANQICTQCIQRDLGELCNQCVGLTDRQPA